MQRESKCDSLIVIIQNIQSSTSSHDSTYKTDIDARLWKPRNCVPVRSVLL